MADPGSLGIRPQAELFSEGAAEGCVLHQSEKATVQPRPQAPGAGGPARGLPAPDFLFSRRIPHCIPCRGFSGTGPAFHGGGRPGGWPRCLASVLLLGLNFGTKVRMAGLLLAQGNARVLAHPRVGEQCHQYQLVPSGCPRWLSLERLLQTHTGGAQTTGCPPAQEERAEVCLVVAQRPGGLALVLLQPTSLHVLTSRGPKGARGLLTVSRVNCKVQAPVPHQSPGVKGELPPRTPNPEASKVPEAVFCLQICSRGLPPLRWGSRPPPYAGKGMPGARGLL